MLPAVCALRRFVLLAVLAGTAVLGISVPAESAYPGMPPTKTCMNCHQQIWVGSDMLAPVRESYRTGRPIEWNRVHQLAEFAYFNHAVHVHKGVSCAVCHGLRKQEAGLDLRTRASMLKGGESGPAIVFEVVLPLNRRQVLFEGV